MESTHTGSATVLEGDCLNVMKTFDDNTFDSIVTDPPAGIAFMNKEWDKNKGGRDKWVEWMASIAIECYRVIKPGGHALVWALPRTSHWTATAWENAGFEVRDKIDHIFGSGFPKSMDVSKALDKVAGVEREVVGKGISGDPKSHKTHNMGNDIADGGYEFGGEYDITVPSTEAAKQWNGWGTALKPAHEDWILLRKPLEGTVAQNVLKWGVGGINIDGCRVETLQDDKWYNSNYPHKTTGYDASGYKIDYKRETMSNNKGRFPANLIHDGSDEVLALFPNTKSGKMLQHIEGGDFNVYGKQYPRDVETIGDSGSAARFFYCAKPSKSERGSYNNHPTVKSITLMRYLCKLITPPNGWILDPFGGSGSTGLAAMEEGFDCIMIERDTSSVEIARRRIADLEK